MPTSAVELPFELHDTIETEPAELHDLYIKAITGSFSKRLAAEYKSPWTEKLETDHQEAISALVAAAKARGLETIRVISVKPDGRRLKFDMSVEKISKDRMLQ